MQMIARRQSVVADGRYLFTDSNRIASMHSHIIQMSVPSRKASYMTHFEKLPIAPIVTGPHNTTVSRTIYRSSARSGNVDAFMRFHGS